MKAIYKRELAAYAHSMTGCVATAFLLAVVGLYFMAYNLYQGAPGFATALNAASFLLILVIPLLTMRSLAEERKNRTDQLLLTAPVSVTGVVLGKFAAMATVFAVPCVLFCLCPLILKIASGSSGVVYFQSDYATILAFFLMGCLFLSIGLLLSALTESQVIAAVATAGVLILLYLWDGIVDFLPSAAAGNLVGVLFCAVALGCLIYHLTANGVIGGVVGGVCAVAAIVCYVVDSTLFESLLPNLLGAFSLTGVLTNFASNTLFDLSGLLLYLSLTALMLFLTVQMIQRRRWN